MAKFYYKAKKGPKDLIEGSIEAETKELALNKISKLGYFPIEVKEERPPEKKLSGGLSFSLFKKVTSSDISIFTRQLADLLNSGIVVLRALEIIYNQTHNLHLKTIILDIRDFVRDGGTLAEGLNRHTKFFSQVYVSMVKSGEVSGTMDVVLNRLADFYDQEEETRSKIRASLAYPLLMAIVGTSTIFILITFVVPRLISLFVELSQALPLPTRILIGTSSFFAKFWWLIIIVIALFFALLKRRQKNKEGKFAIDKFKLKIPFFGDFIKKVELARFARTLGTLLANGITIILAMEVVSQVAENEVLRRDIERMLKDISDGSSLTNALVNSTFFPDVVMNMVAVGEEGGNLEKSLFKIADSYERQADRTVKIITSLLEPIMIVVIGSAVGFIVVAMLLPIFQINLIVR
ncbi:MAG: type II secretion system F family protein [Candidatus Omnitrophota bacterium]|nr:type II secretion system F family protein [Candidatus Omnitrophota bacterium]